MRLDYLVSMTRKLYLQFEISIIFRKSYDEHQCFW